MPMHEIDTIVWDFNGTLLNDVQLCIDSINQLLEKRGLTRLTKEKYLEVFGFPVKDYYERIGFDFSNEPFEIPANQFIELYAAQLTECVLHHGVRSVLKSINQKGYRQVILSAMEQSKLIASVKNLGIDGFFETIAGLDHDYATSKESIGKQLFHKHGISPEKAILVGDTLHDAEIALTLECSAVLVANGHQGNQILKQAKVPILSSIEDLIDFLESNMDKQQAANAPSFVYP